jgi:hypothetical protein
VCYPNTWVVSFCIEIGAKMAPPTMLIAVGTIVVVIVVVVVGASIVVVVVVIDICVEDDELEAEDEDEEEEKTSEKSSITRKMTTGMPNNSSTMPHLIAIRHCLDRPWCSFLPVTGRAMP